MSQRRRNRETNDDETSTEESSSIVQGTGDIATSTSCDEYVDGSIYRVKLHNFLTYNDAEFFPGPRLNLILGPNGTGKSSIVCALCVGLAGSTKVLGRADKVGQFVRHEKDHGYTEIELYFSNGNRVIRRQIFRDHKSIWSLDGRESTLKAVTALMESAKIQIDNLCQFLPQDKVGEFSRMNPMQLLRATENAVLDGELATVHDQITEMQREMVDKEHDLESARASLELKKNENRQRQREVERIVEHESRMQETHLMKKKCLWLEFEAIKEQVARLKEEKKTCQEAMQSAKADKVTPLKEMLEKEAIRLEEMTNNKQKTEKKKRELEDQLKRKKEQVETLESAQTKTVAEMTELRNQHNLTRRKLERLEQDVENWKKEREGMPQEGELKRKKVELEQEQRAKEMEQVEISSTRERRGRELASLERDIYHLEEKLRKLEDEDAQRRLALERVEPDALRAGDWVKRNQHKFKRKVWGPLVLEMQVNEPLHAKYVEDTLQKWMLSCLVTECYDDYNTIIQELNGDSNARTKTSVLIVQDGICHAPNRPYSAEQMALFKEQYAFQSYLDDLVTAPDVILEVLRAHGGLHTVLVGTHRTEEMVNRGVNIFQEVTSVNHKGAFVTPSKKYVSCVSKYGDRHVTTRTNDLKNPRLLAASSSNEEEKEKLKQQIDHRRSEIKKLQSEIDQLKIQERQFAETRTTSSHRIMEIRSQLKTMMRLDEKIGDGDNRIYSLRSELSKDVSDKENAMQRKLKGQCQMQTKQLKDYLKLTQDLLIASAQDASFALQVASQHVRVECTTKQLHQAENSIRELQEAYRQAKERLLDLAKTAMKVKHKAEEEAPWEQYEAAFASLSDDLNELRANIENNEAAGDCFRGDINVREVYERVCQEIMTEEQSLNELRNWVEHGEEKIDAIKQAWHDKLRHIVSQIDASFQQFFREIGCVGEIYLDDHETDISKWGIERRAQFRKNAKLSTMTAEEQSGGEKSVGTIMYLMALQSLTQCPFRVVDEINQGMDVYNERKVFRRITKSSCGGKLPQYFLITPKLITGLEYHRDTKVMIILNGPWNQIRQEEWNVSEFCQKQKKQKILLT